MLHVSRCPFGNSLGHLDRLCLAWGGGRCVDCRDGNAGQSGLGVTAASCATRAICRTRVGGTASNAIIGSLIPTAKRGGNKLAVWGADGVTLVASVHVQSEPGARGDNTRLIAAAPELLAALQLVCDSGCPLSDTITDAMLKAITKAKG